ncbi:MAG TPA: Ig-like domain repeat protein, partial [Anaerolineae bacterium]|nr:Ig-like domain repeat protein [Anaerolineae bacterium]
MQHLRRLLGLRDRDEGLSIILLLSFLFLLIFSLLRGCIGSFSPTRYQKIIVLPQANTPVVRGDLREANVQFTGTAAAGQKVDLFVDNVYLATTSADNIGQWYYAGLIEEEGRHELLLKAKLEDGTLFSTPALPFEIDLRAVSEGESLTARGSSVEYLLQQGEEAQMAEIAAPTIDSGRHGQNVDAGRFTLNGNGVAGRKVRVFANGVALGLATVTNAGTWSYTTDLATTGDYTFRAEDAELANLTTDQFSVNVRPIVQRPTLKIVSGRDHSTVIPLAGTGEPNTTLAIMQNGEQIGLVNVDAAGNWTFDAPRVPDLYDYAFVAVANDATSDLSASSYASRIQFEYKPAPVSATIALATPAVDLANLSFADGVANGELPLNGNASPNGSRVLLFFAGEPFGETTTNNRGEWQLNTGIANLAPGRYELEARIVADDGTILATDTGFIVIPEPAATALNLSDPAIDLATVTIGDDGKASGTLPLMGDGSPAGARVKLFLDGVEIGETTVNADGTYNLPWEWALAPGTYQLTAQLLDDGGAVSA